MQGKLVGGCYRIERQLGRGGFGKSIYYPIVPSEILLKM
jgi:hypothetical protein